MRKKKIKTQVKKDGMVARRSLRRFIEKGDQEKLHKFRVGIKRLRAIASLIEQTTKLNNVRRKLKPIKDTYQLSGQIRDSYLHINLAKEISTVDNQHFDKEMLIMKKGAKKLRKNKAHHLKMLRRAEISLNNRIPNVKSKKVNSFYKQELLAIQECLRTSTGDEHMHDCRKRLKVLLYNLPVVSGVLVQPVNEDYLQQVQNVIGEWHDHVLAAEQFAELSDRSDELMREIRILTQDFFEHATTSVE